MKKLRSALMFVAALGLHVWPGAAQTSPEPQGDLLQQEIQQISQAIARNQRQLEAYQWTESTTMTLNGRSIPPKQSICRYAADGSILNIPLASSSAQTPVEVRGPLKKHVAQHKKEDMQKEAQQIYAVMQRYVPLKPTTLQHILNTGKVDLEHEPAGGDAIILHNYAKSGDEMKIVFDSSKKEVERVSVKTYVNKPEVAMMIDVRFAVLSDGTLYPAFTSVEAPSKKTSMSIVDSNFVKAS